MAVAVSNALERSYLIDVFNASREHRIIAVSAPAGYGKTVAVSQWLETVDHAKAILSIDEYDNDFASFCERFCAVLHSCQPNNQALGDIILHASFEVAPDKFTIRAVSALSHDQQAVIVVDDLHMLEDAKVLQFFLILLRRLPRNVQVVLVSRYELPQVFSELWLKDMIAKIDADNLLFKAEDIISLYKGRGRDITAQQAEEIIQMTNGWPIGINAVWLSEGEPAGKISEYIEEFVQLNIWERWDEPVRDFMLRTSTLRTLVPELCNQLSGRSDSDVFIKRLMQSGAFITHRGGGYNYHDLFRPFLMQMARAEGDGFVNSLYKIEGEWHLAQKNFYDAIYCFSHCKDEGGIIKAFEVLDFANRRNFPLKRFTALLNYPEVEAVLRKAPQFLLLLVWNAFAEGRKEDMLTYMDEYYKKYPRAVLKRPSFTHEVFYVRVLDFRIGAKKIFKANAMLMALLKKLLSGMINPNTIHRWVVPMETPMFHRGLKDLSDLALRDPLAAIDEIEPLVSWIFGGEIAMVKPMLCANFLYEQGKLEEAYKYAKAGVAEIKSEFVPELVFCALAINIMVSDALGINQIDEQTSLTHRISQLIDSHKAYHLSNNFLAFKARREIAAGSIEAAQAWLEEDLYDVPPAYNIYIDITKSRAHIKMGKYDAAIVILERVLLLAIDFARSLDIIEVNILLAIAFWNKKHGYQTTALEHLQQAVATAAPYRYTQLFINEGPELTNMLSSLATPGSRQLHAAIEAASQNANKKPKTATAKKDIKYTAKQLSIMKLLCLGHSYEEMAQILQIKKSTLRSHLELIYSKLDVTNMLDAIARIEEMKLLKD